MNNENEANVDIEEESCLACELVLEFKEMCDADVHWESALRHVLHVALEIRDDIIADVVDENYTLGFEEGLAVGVAKAAATMNELVEYTEEQIADYRAEREAELTGEFDIEAEEEIEDISDEEFDKIAKLIRESQGRN